MTSRRHHHYRRALQLLRAPEPGWLPPAERKLVEELAEDMLLCRESDPQAVLYLRREAERAVAALAVVGVLAKPTAVELTQSLVGAGPPLLSVPQPSSSRRAA